MAKITGAQAHLKRLKGMNERAQKEARKLVYALADMHATEAAHILTAGSVSGKNHVPSAPGSPPNADTHVLDRSIHVEEVGPLKAHSVADAPYAAIHEFGGSIDHPGGTPYFMKDGKPTFVSKSGYGAYHTLPVTKPHKIEVPERPYMRPAAATVRKDIDRLAKAAVKRINKGGTL